VRVCAARDLDAILVARPELVGADSTIAAQRERLRGDLLQGINDSLADLKGSGAGIGIEVARVDLQSTLPRNTASAFNAVLTASQQAEKAVAEARTDAAWAMQTANQTADRSLEVARAQASERLAKAQTDTSTVLVLTRSMKDKTDPGLPLRMYRERMRTILAKTGSVTMVDPKDGSRLIVPGAAP
jgi:regulator of protease activity HflC (stomatin/prohibitin superfamily)